jgi:transposase
LEAADRSAVAGPARALRSLEDRSPTARAKAPAAADRAFDAERYADRNVVERCFNRLKQFRDLATRYAQRAAYYRAQITIAAIVLWLRTGLQDAP